MRNVLRTGRKPIICRWRDIDKGASERVEVRSRLAAREITQQGTDSHFAGTPPLAFVRYVISKAATPGKRRQLMVLDAKRAFLHAGALTETYVKLPHLRDTEQCWLPKKCMHASCSGRMATPCPESWYRYWLAQLKQLSMCVVAGDGDDFDLLSQKLMTRLRQ